MVLYDTVDKNIKKKLLWNIFVKILNLNMMQFLQKIYISLFILNKLVVLTNNKIMLIYYFVSILYPLIIHVNESNLWKKILTIFFYIFSSTSVSQGIPYILYFTLHVIYIYKTWIHYINLEKNWKLYNQRLILHV